MTGLQSFGLTVRELVLIVQALHKHLILVIELGGHIRCLVHNLLDITVPRGHRSGMQLREQVFRHHLPCVCEQFQPPDGPIILLYRLLTHTLISRAQILPLLLHLPDGWVNIRRFY